MGSSPARVSPIYISGATDYTDFQTCTIGGNAILNATEPLASRKPEWVWKNVSLLPSLERRVKLEMLMSDPSSLQKQTIIQALERGILRVCREYDMKICQVPVRSFSEFREAWLATPYFWYLVLPDTPETDTWEHRVKQEYFAARGGTQWIQLIHDMLSTPRTSPSDQ